MSDGSQLLSAFPQGLSPSDLIREYRRAFGRELYLFGFSSIIDLCFQLPNVVYVQNSGPDWLLLPAAAKETMKIVDLNNQREVKSLLKKFDSLFKKRLENSWKESGRLVSMLRGWCKQLEDEGDLQQKVEYIGDNLQDLKIGRDQKQYKGFGEDEQKLLKKIRDQRHRLEAERYSQQLVSVGGGCQNHVEGGGNKEQLFNREIHQMRDVNFDDEEEDYEMEAVRDEYSFSDLSVISVHTPHSGSAGSTVVLSTSVSDFASVWVCLVSPISPVSVICPASSAIHGTSCHVNDGVYILIVYLISINSPSRGY